MLAFIAVLRRVFEGNPKGLDFQVSTSLYDKTQTHNMNFVSDICRLASLSVAVGIGLRQTAKNVPRCSLRPI